jgi:hypothetical protein
MTLRQRCGAGSLRLCGSLAPKGCDWGRPLAGPFFWQAQYRPRIKRIHRVKCLECVEGFTKDFGWLRNSSCGGPEGRQSPYQDDFSHSHLLIARKSGQPLALPQAIDWLNPFFARLRTAQPGTLAVSFERVHERLAKKVS